MTINNPVRINAQHLVLFYAHCSSQEDSLPKLDRRLIASLIPVVQKSSQLNLRSVSFRTTGSGYTSEEVNGEIHGMCMMGDAISGNPAYMTRQGVSEMKLFVEQFRKDQPLAAQDLEERISASLAKKKASTLVEHLKVMLSDTALMVKRACRKLPTKGKQSQPITQK